MDEQVSLKDVLALARQLPAPDKARLIERLAPEIERELMSLHAVPCRSLRGLWRGLDITAEDILQVRQEMWSGFPRGDI